MNINVNDAEDMACPKCENQFFKPIFRVKKISPLLSPTGEEVIVPIQLLACMSCEHIVSDIK